MTGHVSQMMEKELHKWSVFLKVCVDETHSLAVIWEGRLQRC